MCNKTCILVIVTLVMIQSNCAKRIPITYNELKNNLFVDVNTKSGSSYKGIITKKNNNFIVVQTDENSRSLNKIAKNNINSIKYKPPVLDDKKRIISEFEISRYQDNKNTLFYTIGGTGLSFGTSFFIGSLLHRSISDSEAKNIALWSTTGIGTVLGTSWFFHKGKLKDRNDSIMTIRELRYKKAKNQITKQKIKKDKVQEEMEKIKAERSKQNKELEELKEKLNKQKKKESK